MPSIKGKQVSRRDFIRLAAGSAALGPFFLFPGRALASQKTLKIAKWAHFLPEFDQWFVNVMAQEWGRQNDTRVTVDIIPVEEIRGRAFAEVKASNGHDVFIFPWSPAEYRQNAIDHGDVYQEVAASMEQSSNSRTGRHSIPGTKHTPLSPISGSLHRCTFFKTIGPR